MYRTMKWMTGMKYIFFVFCFAALAIIGVPQAHAESRSAAEAVAEAETYLRNLGTAQARFLQTAHDGSQVIGTFYLNRPGRLRFDYDDPVEDFVVADGRFIYFYDSQLREQSNALIGQTLADFILREDLRMGGDLDVVEVRHAGELLLISLVQRADPGAGMITLGFEENPMQLRKWRITDATGAITEVELFQMRTNVALDRNLFFYRDPDFGRTPRYNP